MNGEHEVGNIHFSINIAFAALIHAYGKPIEITQSMVDALPEQFTIEVERHSGVNSNSEATRIYSVKEKK